MPSNSIPGSSLVIDNLKLHFEHQLPDGTWQTVGLVTEDGESAVSGSKATGTWYFPEATRTRIRIDQLTKTLADAEVREELESVLSRLAAWVLKGAS